MLVLTRKCQERIQIGNNITVTIVRIKGSSVRVGIEAPKDVRVIRGELEQPLPEGEGERGGDAKTEGEPQAQSAEPALHARVAQLTRKMAGGEPQPAATPAAGTPRALGVRRPRQLGPASLRSMSLR